MFPAFDDRTANIYNALYCTRKPEEIHEEKVAAFQKRCDEQLGEGVALNPENIIDSKRFEVKTGDAKVSVDPERSYLVETRIIDGRKYILIPADESVEVTVWL